MRNFNSIISRPLVGAFLATVLAATAFTAPVQADSSTAQAKITVPRLFKGTRGGVVDVNPSSPEARMYLASQVSFQDVTAKGFCPGTICLQTTTCRAFKGALGAGCKTR